MKGILSDSALTASHFFMRDRESLFYKLLRDRVRETFVR